MIGEYPPTVTSMTPNTGTQNTILSVYDLEGSNFGLHPPPKVYFWYWIKIGQYTFPLQEYATNVNVVSRNKITCTFDLAGIPPGQYTVYVENPDGEYGTLNNGLTVNPPWIQVIVPNGGEKWAAGTTHTVTWAQEGLDNTNVRIELWKNWPIGLHIRDIAVSVPATAGSYTWTIPADVAPSTTYWVNITSISYPTVTDYTDGWLEITAPPAPVPTSVTPNHGQKGTQVIITNLAGSNFQQGDQVAVLNASTILFEAVNVVVESPTKITCTFRIPSSARSGIQDVRVGSAVHGYGTLKNGFTIDPGYVMFTFSPSKIPLGKTVHISGVNTDNTTTYLYLIDTSGLSCDPNGCPLTDLTKKASNGYFTKVTNAGDASFEYFWDTSTVAGNLVPGTYGIVVESDPVDYAHRTGHQYVKGQIVIEKKLVPLPGYANPPTDPDNDGIYEDLNANGRLDFADVVLYFNQMTWISANEPVGAFDLNKNGRIDFADIVALFNEI
jgi:PKD repeat protein